VGRRRHPPARHLVAAPARHPFRPWTVALTFVYALALAGLAHLAVRPYLDAQGWMIGASLLSVAFLVYGAFARVWPVAAVGQVFLALALYHFFFPPDPNVFPWTWWAAALPVMVVFATARAAHEWLRLFTEIPASWRGNLRVLVCGYQLAALVALVRWVFRNRSGVGSNRRFPLSRHVGSIDVCPKP